jgi:type I restriction enzyme, S subunit
VVGGGTPSKEKPEYFSGNIPWATVRDMRSDVILETEFKITEDAIANSATNVIPRGNVVIASRVGLGKVCLLGRDIAINQDLRGIIPNDLNTLSVPYLFAWLKSISHKIVEAGTGATVQGVKLPFIKSLKIPLPTLPEQKRIVGILEKASEAMEVAKANAEKNLQNARELYESCLNEEFANKVDSSVEKPLGECVKDIVTGPFGSLLHKSDYEVGGIPIVNPINIDGERIIADERKAVGRTTAKRLSTYILRENDVVIGRRGEIGRCAVVRANQAGWLCGTGCFVIRPSEITNPYYLTHLIRSRVYRGLLEDASGRATMPNISNDDLASLVISLPPIAQQVSMLGRLEVLSAEVEHIESIYQQKLTALDELKKSLLHQAFNGDL